VNFKQTADGRLRTTLKENPTGAPTLANSLVCIAVAHMFHGISDVH